MCTRLNIDAEILDVEWGEGFPTSRLSSLLECDRAHHLKAVLVTHNETATGVTNDISAIRTAMTAARHPALLLVDGISSIACIDFRMDEWGVDVAVSGSQKGFMLPSGLALLCVSQRVLEHSRKPNLRPCFFDFAEMASANSHGYFPYTPPLHLLRGLRAALDLLFDEGLENVFARHRKLARGVRAAIEAWGLSLCAKNASYYSNTVSTICTPDTIDADALIRHAYHSYRLSLGVGLGRLAGSAFRIGHLGDINELMILSALGGIELAMRDQGVNFAVGSGVAAAIEQFHKDRA